MLPLAAAAGVCGGTAVGGLIVIGWTARVGAGFIAAEAVLPGRNGESAQGNLAPCGAEGGKLIGAREAIEGTTPAAPAASGIVPPSGDQALEPYRSPG